MTLLFLFYVNILQWYYLHSFTIKLHLFWPSFVFLSLPFSPLPPTLPSFPWVSSAVTLTPPFSSLNFPLLQSTTHTCKRVSSWFCRYIYLTLVVKYELLDLLWITVLLLVMSWDNSEETRALFQFTLHLFVCLFLPSILSPMLLVSLPKIPTPQSSYYLNNMFLLYVASLILNKLLILL